MSAPAYKLDAVTVAEDLLDLAAKHGSARALSELGELWPRLDSPAPIAGILAHWAKDYTPAGLRALLMGHFDRRAEKAFRLKGRPVRVYRVGVTETQARSGLVWHRLKRHARAHGREIGAEFIATALLGRDAYAAAKCRPPGARVEFIVLPEAAPKVAKVEPIGGRRNV